MIKETSINNNDFPAQEVCEIARKTIEICTGANGWYLRVITVDDLVQETALKALQYWDTFDRSKSKLETWVSRLARQRLADAVKRERGMVPLEHRKRDGKEYVYYRYIDGIAPGYEADREMETREAVDLIQEAIDALPESQGNILGLSMDEGLKPRHIAERTGYTADAATVLLCRARKAVRRRLGDEFLSEHGFAA